MKNIELNIEELVLNGFNSRDGHEIGESIKTELARLFRERGLPTWYRQSMEISSLTCDPISVNSRSRPDTVGIQAARAIYKGFCG